MDLRQRRRIIARCERFVVAWNAPRDPAAEFRALADRAGARLDVYGDGETVERLEARVAELLGKEGAVLFPSGTMAQQIALRIWCERGGSSTVAFHPQCHLDVHEERGYAHLHALHARPVGHRDRLVSRADLDEVTEPVGALLLELPQRDLGGQLPAWRELRAQVTWARRKGIALHLDGARLWQCGPFYRRPLREIAGLFDTVYVSLYKDLHALGGCLLAGPKDVIAEARVWRIRHGGRLSTFEPMALSAERGLDEVLPRMSSFVRKAREIGAALARLDGVGVVPDPPQVAMLHVTVRGELERVNDALFEIAKERRTLIASGFEATPLPNVQRAELGIGEPSLAVPTAEIAELYAELVSRAAAPSRPRAPRPRSAPRRGKRRGS
ncbi:MAG TPA: beta-eliminating lyase-related protein [Gaiellaceae bacterium]|nr:beta-eliminating lyase-related protein [Gaiellaceae bacterium]